MKAKNKIFFETFTDTKNYMNLTAQAIADAIRKKRGDRTIIYVDGLRKSQIPKFKRYLKPSVKMTVKVRGVKKEENNAFIRLVYAICGLVRDAEDNQQWALSALRRLKRRNILTEL